MTDAFILDAVRTPRGRGRPDGSLHAITPVQLAAQTLAAIRDRNSLDTNLVDDVVLGCVSPVGEQGADIARVAALVAGYAESVPGKQINRFCASALESVNTAAAQVMSGQDELVIGGGVESMSRVPMGSDGGAWAIDPQVAWHQYFVPQGVSADLIATLDGHTREQVDAYAVESQRRAALAQQAGHFDRSVVPVKDVIGQVVLARDEYLRPGTSLEDLAKLKPAFVQVGEEGGFDAVAIQRYPQVESISHVHTAGNSSGIVDGAAAVLVGSRRAARKAGLRARARIVGFASIGSEPTIMLTGPAAASRKALKRARMKPLDIDLWEINEAFASVVLRYQRDMELAPDQVNVNGGAIALGHPLGATGAVILGTVLDELERRDLSTALVTLCVGAGMGTATIIERV
ncbi:MAG: acetyl-CoA C-acetyltransferase [Steroidobacteraceae bacterium]|nr:acetyl-CoA C-acetyltransferase [Steroidobacteraceae bacterium]